MRRPKALFILEPYFFNAVYGPRDLEDLQRLCEFPDHCYSKEEIVACPSVLDGVEWIFSSWGAPELNEEFLEATPDLKAFFYAAGSIKGFVTEAFWQQNIPITSAFKINAIPVAEFTVAQIILSQKWVWQYNDEIREKCDFPSNRQPPGFYGRTVAIISLGTIGKMVAERLRHFDARVIAYDPFIAPEEATELGVELVSLEEAFASADIVSLHTPLLAETVGMIDGHLFSSMKKGAVFINTARGRLIKEDEMAEVLRKRTDLFALLDLTVDEPPQPDSPLYILPNVRLTPHIAGSTGTEIRRMGRCMVEEASRFLAGKPLRWQITREKEKILA
jgi:phosphoglycerate dehydrogenase-like enzyme